MDDKDWSRDNLHAVFQSVLHSKFVQQSPTSEAHDMLIYLQQYCFSMVVTSTSNDYTFIKYPVYNQSVSDTSASTTFPWCSRNVRSAKVLEISISRIWKQRQNTKLRDSYNKTN
jgi:hypothetical protein